MSIIGNFASKNQLKGEKSHRVAEPDVVSDLSLDFSSKTASNVQTNVDCYVSGTYITSSGDSVEIIQRYSVFITYNRDTLDQALSAVRQNIMDDFNKKYGDDFEIGVVNVEPPKKPISDDIEGISKGKVEDLEMYSGSDMFREITNYEEYIIQRRAEREKYEFNRDRIKREYIRNRYKNPYDRSQWSLDKQTEERIKRMRESAERHKNGKK